MFNKSLLLAALVLLAATLLTPLPADARRPKPPEVFRIQGDSQSLASVIFPLKELFQSEAKMALLVTGELSPLRGLVEVDSGIGDALVVAMTFEELNRLATDAGTQRRNKAMTQHTVLLNEIPYSVIVNPANPVKKLSTKELRRLFSGRYKDWDDVDAPKGPVSVVWGEWSTGSSWILADRVMDGEPVLKESVKASGISDIVARVAADRNAIAVIPSAAVTPEVKTVETLELKIEGPIILVTVGFPIAKHFQLMKLIKGEGSKYIGY